LADDKQIEKSLKSIYRAILMANAVVIKDSNIATFIKYYNNE